jgi:hypothetical protein
MDAQEKIKQPQDDILFRIPEEQLYKLKLRLEVANN